MEATVIAVAVSLVAAFIAFLSRELLLPAVQNLRDALLRPRRCRRLLDAAWLELDVNIQRLAEVSIASQDVAEDGTERVVYRFGSSYSGLPAPELPTLGRRALGDLRSLGTRCLGSAAGAVEDALTAIGRYEAIDHDQFRTAWHASMNPVMERTVVGDPGRQVNAANAKAVMDTDRVVRATRAALADAKAGFAGNRRAPKH
jgi:hypothetical protein